MLHASQNGESHESFIPIHFKLEILFDPAQTERVTREFALTWYVAGKVEYPADLKGLGRGLQGDHREA